MHAIKSLLKRLNPRSHEVLPTRGTAGEATTEETSADAQEALRPSKVAIVLYFMSCVFCVLGIIMIVHSFFYVAEEDKVQVLGTGSGLVGVGVILALIMNWMNKREHERFVQYVYKTAEQMQANANSRQTFNREYEHHPEGTNGPYGIH